MLYKQRPSKIKLFPSCCSSGPENSCCEPSSIFRTSGIFSGSFEILTKPQSRKRSQPLSQSSGNLSQHTSSSPGSQGPNSACMNARRETFRTSLRGASDDPDRCTKSSILGVVTHNSVLDSRSNAKAGRMRPPKPAACGVLRNPRARRTADVSSPLWAWPNSLGTVITKKHVGVECTRESDADPSARDQIAKPPRSLSSQAERSQPQTGRSQCVSNPNARGGESEADRDSRLSRRVFPGITGFAVAAMELAYLNS